MGLGKLQRQVYVVHQQMIAFGESRYALEQKAISEGKKWWTYLQKKIFTVDTLKAYRQINYEFVRFCWKRFQIASVYAITPRMMRAYVREHAARLSIQQMRAHLSAIVKLGEGLGKSESFHRVANQMDRRLCRRANVPSTAPRPESGMEKTPAMSESNVESEAKTTV